MFKRVAVELRIAGSQENKMMCKFTIAIITFSPAKLYEVSFLFLSDYRIKDCQTIGLSAYGTVGLFGR
jgi:hypothetical protein